VDLTSYADLAVRLVNSAGPGRPTDDGLTSVESYGALVADRPHLAGRVTANDLEALRLLREELRQIFAAAARHEGAQVAERLNALLTRYPIHQQLVSHDGKRWHVHLVDSGSAADRHAAGAIAGLTGLVAESGMDRLGFCAAEGCERVLIAPRAGAGKSYCSDGCTPKANVHALRATGRASSQGPATTAAS
jgi:predicted RNA-binding Zn ribbon-like protein